MSKQNQLAAKQTLYLVRDKSSSRASIQDVARRASPLKRHDRFYILPLHSKEHSKKP